MHKFMLHAPFGRLETIVIWDGRKSENMSNLPCKKGEREREREREGERERGRGRERDWEGGGRDRERES